MCLISVMSYTWIIGLFQQRNYMAPDVSTFENMLLYVDYIRKHKNLSFSWKHRTRILK